MTVPAQQSTTTPAGRSRTWRGDWQIAVVIFVVFAAGVFFLWHRTHSDRSHSVILPATLLGMTKESGQNALQTAQNLVADEQAYDNTISNPVAALYGNSTGTTFDIVAGGPCQCVLPTPQQAVQQLKAQGDADATSFPPGNPGGLLMCSTSTGQNGQAIECSWIDQASAGQARFSVNYTPTLTDAAAKTRQLRDVLER